MERRIASKKNVLLRIANCGESNSGKTFSASIIASVINDGMKGVTIIDTENRADLYSEHFPGATVKQIPPPFDPEKLIEALAECAKLGDKFVIVDSASDFWDRTVQIHGDIVGTNRKIAYYAWSKVTPRWDALRAAITNAPFHIITCWRMKDKLVNKDGEMVVEGQRVVSRGGSKGIKYDYHIAFIINDKHQALVGKDNLHLFSDWKEPRVIDKAVAEQIKSWIKQEQKPNNKGVQNERSKQSDSIGETGPGPRA